MTKFLFQYFDDVAGGEELFETVEKAVSYAQDFWIT